MSNREILCTIAVWCVSVIMHNLRSKIVERWVVAVLVAARVPRAARQFGVIGAGIACDPL